MLREDVPFLRQYHLYLSYWLRKSYVCFKPRLQLESLPLEHPYPSSVLRTLLGYPLPLDSSTYGTCFLSGDALCHSQIVDPMLGKLAQGGSYVIERGFECFNVQRHGPDISICSGGCDYTSCSKISSIIVVELQ